MNRVSLLISLVALLAGCASPDPMVTGNPHDWKGKAAVDLKTAWGEPTRIIPSESGDEVWEYLKVDNRIVPKGESMSFGFGGLGSRFGGAGAFSSEKRPEDRPSREEYHYRFKIRAGKIIAWYAARFIDGRKVWEDH